MRIAIMGVGSLGTILGAYITKGGIKVDLIDVNKEHVNVLNEKGATVKGKANFNVSVNAITPEQIEGIYDLVFYMVKQTYDEVALKQILPHLNEASVVCTLQNGVPEPNVAKIVGTERTIGGTVGWGATWLEPGVSELTTNADIMTFDLGEINGEITDRLLKVKAILELMCKTELMVNLTGIRWTKLLANCTFSGMSASLGCTFGEILDNEKALECIKHLANECINVSLAQGIIMEAIQGFDLGKLLAFSTEEERSTKDEIYQKMWGPHRSSKASMLQDLEKGRKSEIDAINGVVCNLGRKFNVATPVNEKVVEVVKGIESGKYKYEFTNLDMFEIPKI
jgi:2-dehydropantoate 2-reductase